MKKITMTNKDGKQVDFWRVSRWISIRQNYNPNKKNPLWDFVTDANGYKTGDGAFNPSEGLFLDYFKFNGRTYAVDQFYTLGCMWVNEAFTYTEDGEKKSLSAVDMYGDLYNPYYIELDEYGERVRVYEKA